MSRTPVPSSPTGESATAAPQRESFFDWLRRRGTVRGDGLLGGVCAGLAQRLRVDPLIVRGLFVVAALLGLPMLLIYAIAWALLPDVTGRIHLQRHADGRSDPARVGILILFLIGLVPVVPWVFGALLGSVFIAVNLGLTQVAIVLLLIAVIVALVFLLTRGVRHRRHSGGAVRSSVPLSASATVAPLTSGETASPAEPAAGDADPELIAWREGQESWKRQDATWREAQQDAEYHAREQARLEQEQATAAFAAEVTARRLARQASRPRTSAAYVAIVVGLAIVAGARGMLRQTDAAENYFIPAWGLLIAAVITALGMVLAGILRRRSGFLTSLAALLLALGLGAGAVGLGLSLSQHTSTASGGPIIHPLGSMSVAVVDVGDPTTPVTVERRHGGTHLHVQPGVQLRLEATVGSDVTIVWVQSGPDYPWDEQTFFGHDGRFTEVFRSFFDPDDPITTHQTVRITQESGTIYISTWEGE